MRPIILLCLFLLPLGCSRPLTGHERAFAATVQGRALNADPVRLTRGNLIGTIIRTRPPRPALTCRERIRQPEVGDIRVSTAAFVLFNRIFTAERVYRDDYLPDYPRTLSLSRAMFLAHELTHVWQWQNRAVTGYHPLKAAAEHHPGGDPYLFDLGENRSFVQFGYEQQAGIVEEFVCCRTLDPEGTRTARLFALLHPYLPDLQRDPEVGRNAVSLPWSDADIGGVCG